ncbi:hypothetical protein Tco_0394801 [Tanacetum coccineum]
MAPIVMQRFLGKEFPQDGNMVLETLLNNNPTRIRRYPEEFLVFFLIGLSHLWCAPVIRRVFYDEDKEEMRLQDFIKVPNPFDVVCAKKKLPEIEKHILEQTADPPLLLESMHKKGEECGGSSSSVGAIEDSTSKANDTLSIQLSDDPPPVTASKVGELSCISTTAPSKNDYLSKARNIQLLGNLCQIRRFRRDWSSERRSTSQILPKTRLLTCVLVICYHVVRGEADESESLVFARPRPDPVLRGSEREVGHQRKQVEELNVEAGKVPGEAEVKAEFARMLDTQQRMFNERVADLDARLDKMVKETDEEFALMLRDARKTKKFIIGNGFHYFLNKFRESEMLGTRLGACISANILDGMRQCLEAGFVHGK